ncbi:MAG: aminopeptidase, partial [Hydrogenophaga sp.]
RGCGGVAGDDPSVAQANTARYAAQAAYDALVPAFEALFEREGRDFARFYDAVRTLAALPKEERQAQLRRLAPAGAPQVARHP